MAKSKYVHTIPLDLDVSAFEKKAKLASSYKLVSDENKKAWAQMLAQVDIYKAEIKQLQDSLKQIEGISNDIANAQRDEWTKALEEVQKQYDAFIGHTEETIPEVKEGFKDVFGDILEERRKSLADVQKQFFEDGLDKVDEFGKKLVGDAKEFFKSIKEVAVKMLEKISEFSDKSTKFSEEATSLRLGYGLTGAQAYAYQMAAEKTGFGSFEGYLENVVFATQETRDRFDELLKKYEQSYEQDKEFAETYQKFKTDFEDFKVEAGMTLLQFFSDNKDVIKWFMQTSVNVLGGILSAMKWIMQFLGNTSERTASERASSLSDIYNSYGGNKTITVKVDNTFNNVNPSQKNNFENAGAMIRRQIIEALN